MSDEKLKELLAKRSSIKGRITKFKNNLDVLQTLEKVSTIEISKLAMKLSKFEALFIEFDELQCQIEVINFASQSSELAARDLMEQDFYHCIATAQTMIQENSSSNPGDIKSNPSHSVTSHCHYHDSDNDVLGFRLPVIKIPNFDGTYYKWLEFKETFSSLIHANSKILNIHKFHYLNSYLEGEASRVVCNLEVTDKNYTQAWQLLCERYDNKRQLINNHLKSLFNLEAVRETDKSLRFIIDHVTKNLRALSTLGLPTDKWDVLIIYIVTAKLDNSTCFKWEEHRNTLPDIPTLDNFFTFLKNRADVLETVQRNRQEKPKPHLNLSHTPQQKTQTKAFAVTSKEPSSSPKSSLECVVCKGSHRIYECSSFKAKTPADRVSVVSSLNLCHNCLRGGHDARRCKLPGTCRYCKMRHNTLLHTSDKQPIETKTESISMSAISSSEILLCTAQVQIANPITKHTISVRALLDSGSQSSFITENVMRKLNLSPQPSPTSIVGIGDTPLKLNTKRCTLHLKSNNTSFNVLMTCLILPTISGNLPKFAFDIKHLNLSEFSLADPSFNEPSPIDMLIGADLFWDIIGSQQHALGKKNPILRSSKLGWLIAGPVPILTHSTKSKDNQIHCNFLLKNTLSNEPNLNDELKRFWEIENFPQTQPLTQEEKLCEQHFLRNTTRLEDGRFCVALPLRDDRDCLGNTFNMAKKRFLNLEARFRREPVLKKAYSDFIHEYAALGHLSETNKQGPNSYFLPHHPVIREQSESTKLRVVFDASARSTSGFSVNDLQMVGPILQDSLFEILIRFRQHKYVLSGDIEKMFRQIYVRESDRDLQLILWRDSEADSIQTLQLNTVTYGFSSASFLSTRCIWQLGEECEDSSIKTIIQKDFYCDDLLTGTESKVELLHIQRSVSVELAKGGFHLRKYRSNLPDLLFVDNISTEEGKLMISNATSTLGIGWIPTSDELNFQIQYSAGNVLTKRTILSSTFKIFDPLGLLSPCTIKPKIILQELWSLKLDWDEPVPPEIESSWLRFTNHLSALSLIKIPRCILINKPNSIEMHCFCDASQRAYGTCIYLRSIDLRGNILVHLLCAKARVAPIKYTTIPRLELCGALLGAQLTTTITKALRCQVSRHTYWTDSTVVLGWLKAPGKTKTFVANRVCSINELTDSTDWRHVSTSNNPADLVSRGIDPQQLGDSSIWWHGPSFLTLPESSWPTSNPIELTRLPELKAHSALVAEPATSSDEVQYFDIFKYSKLNTLQRVYARVLRFIHNCKNPTNKLSGPLHIQELEKALKFIIKIAQKNSFKEEITMLQKNKQLNSKATLSSLTPFLDTEGILRVGGRIDSANYPYDKRHPIVLKADHHITKLIFLQEHARLMHAGPQHLLASIRERYWPIGGRNLARRVARECFICRRFKGQTMTNIMGNLPSERVEPDFPFRTVGTDFAGPFLITDRKGRGCKVTKCYLCIFVCFRYKCIHLEAVSELTKDAFVLTLKRFIARRGIPKLIYCDNGRNFVAAAKEIENFFKSHSDIIIDFAVEQGFEFRFSPVYAPHYNGLAEAGVKSAKFHLRRIVGNSHLTFEELSSLFVQVEAILNSRPLCPLSPSPHDFHPLTPGHFLIGRPLTSLPSPSFVDYSTHRLDRYQRLEQMRQHFWKRWTSEYIAELQQRTKWRVRCRNLQLNDLVLIKEDNVPPLCWRLGRVSKLFPGPDGVPRVADITTLQGTIRRAINRLCLLPSPDTKETPDERET